MAEHTYTTDQLPALPLRTDAARGCAENIIDSRGVHIAECWSATDLTLAEGKLVAAEIVRRVNAHDELVAALRELRDFYTDMTGLPACKANAVLAKVERR